MADVTVTLPADNRIDGLAFCQLIAQALFPVDEKALCGIACIVAKRVDCVPAAQALRAPSDESLPLFLGGKFDHLILSSQCSDLFTPLPGEQPQLPNVDMVLPLQYALTDDDRQFLKSVLSKLPSLQYPITTIEEKFFIDAWRTLPDRPRWEPVLINELMIESRKAQQHAAMLMHRQRLQSEMDHARIVVVDAAHSPVTRLFAGCFIPRTQAIEYLHRIGILHNDELADDLRSNRVPHDMESGLTKTGNGRKVVGERILTDADRKGIVEETLKLEKQGAKAPRKKVAAKFGVTERTVYNILVEAGVVKKRTPPIDQRLASRRS